MERPHRPASASRGSSKRPIQPPAAAFDHDTSEKYSVGHRGAAPPPQQLQQRDLPLHLHELASSQHFTARPRALNWSRSNARTRSFADTPDSEFDLPVCECSDFHSLRCCTKAYGMLHRQIELDAVAKARAATAAARVADEQRRLRAMFGGEDVPPELLHSASASASAAATDSWSAQVPAASLRFHVSDFTLGNLKNQATRVVLPPTVVFSAPAAATAGTAKLHSSTPAVQYYFTSMQSGEIMRKTREKVSPQRILDDMLRFARVNMGQALAALGRHADEAALVAAARGGAGAGGRGKDRGGVPQPERAWEMERDEYTQQLQQHGTGAGGGKAALPHYMRATKNLSSSAAAASAKSALSPSATAVSAATGRASKPPPFAPASEWATRDKAASTAAAAAALQQPFQPCDIIAQFTFASDAPRFDDPNLPYTSPSAHDHAPLGGGLDPHRHPDVLYLSARSLHHFLMVVNADFSAPRALGVLQPFVRPMGDRNTVYRVAYTALPSSSQNDEETVAIAGAAHAGASGVSSSSSAAQLGPSSLPSAFHVSVEARQNVLPLLDHTGLLAAASAAREGRPRTTAQQFSLAERAVTFDASHLSLQVDAPRARTADAAHGGAQAATATVTAAGKSNILHPKVSPALAPAPSATVAAPSAATGSHAPATLVVPSGYPWAPSGSTAAQRLRVPAALQERLQACVLRVVAHINELYRAGDATTAAGANQAAKAAALAALQRELYGSAAPLPSQPITAPAPTASAAAAPSISVGFLEAFFKIDAENNLHLLNVRSIKHLVREAQSESDVAGEEVVVRCAQCSRRCAPPQRPEVLALTAQRAGGSDHSAPLLRPTSAVLADRERARANAANRTSRETDGEYRTPFYARHRGGAGGDDDDEEEARRVRRRAAAAAAASTSGGHSSIVYGSVRRRPGRDSPPRSQDEDEEEDRDLWPESHFNPPPPPASQFSAVSERIQSNPLFSDAIRDEDDGGSDDDEDSGRDERRGRAGPVQKQQRHRLDRPAPPLTEDEEAASLDRALQRLRPELSDDPASAAPRRSGPSSSTADSAARKQRPSSATAALQQSRPGGAAATGSNGTSSNGGSKARAKTKDPSLGVSSSSAALSSRAAQGGAKSGSVPKSSRSRPASAAPERRPSAAASRAPTAPHPREQLASYMIPTRVSTSVANGQWKSQWRADSAQRGGGSALGDYQSPYPTAPPNVSAPSAAWSSPPPSSGAIRVYSVHATSPAELAKLAALYPQIAPKLARPSSASARGSDSRRTSGHVSAGGVGGSADARGEWDDSGADLSVEIEEGQP